MREVMLAPLAALMLAVVPASAHATVGSTSLRAQADEACEPANSPCFRLESTIAFVSNREPPDVGGVPDRERASTGTISAQMGGAARAGLG